jgi:hypothetical protein
VSNPFSLRIFVADGDPDGLRVVERSNWIGKALVFPRALLPKVKQRDELGQTGVVLLLGPRDDGEGEKLYIGEGDPIRPRLESHYAQKDFWTRAIGFTTTTAGQLNKAHVQFLESRLIALARAANAWLHVVHVSSPYSIDLITQARAAGIKVTCETCPPYLFLTDADLATHGPYAKTNPPVRDEFIVEAMWERVARGEVDIIGTDHSPFLASEKEPGWDNMWAAPPGAPGIEILVPLMLTAVAYGRITLERMVALLSTNSAEIFGMAGRKGVIAVGADADLMLVDLAAEGRIDTSTWESKSRVTARLWHGRQTRGAVVA